MTSARSLLPSVGAHRTPPGFCRRQRGMGLVELMLVLVISALLVALGMRLYQNMREEQNAVAQVRHVTQVITRLQSLFGASGYAFLSTLTATDPNYCALIAMVTPSELWSPNNDCTGGKSAYHLSDGKIDIQAPDAALGLPSGAYAALVWDRVPVGQCMPLVVGTEGLTAMVQISGEPRTSGTLQPNSKTVKALGAPLDVASLAEWCSTEELSNSATPGAPPTTNSVKVVRITFIISS